MNTPTTPTPGDIVRHASFPCALHFVGYVTEQHPVRFLIEEEDEDGNTVERWEDDWTETEDVEDTSRAVVVMVGDDQRHHVDVEELEAIEEDEDGDPGYCPSCGALDCMHGR